jgi:hypothetical protein
MQCAILADARKGNSENSSKKSKKMGKTDISSNMKLKL